ncbi:MAG: hypothetical protein QXI37_03445, partial [Thermoprotei archaeon]
MRLNAVSAWLKEPLTRERADVLASLTGVAVSAELFLINGYFLALVAMASTFWWSAREDSLLRRAMSNVLEEALVEAGINRAASSVVSKGSLSLRETALQERGFD